MALDKRILLDGDELLALATNKGGWGSFDEDE